MHQTAAAVAFWPIPRSASGARPAQRPSKGARRSAGGRLLALFLACAAQAGPAAADPKITADVIYGHKDGLALTYDVFEAEAPNGAGVIYMVSAGWFSTWQPPEQRAATFAPLLAEGFAVFAVRHGSAPRFKVPDAVADVRAAVRHIRSEAKTFGVDAERLGVWGQSAGGHLSLMLGLNSEATPEVTASGPRARFLEPAYAANAESDAEVASIVAFFPPVDLRPLVGPNERFPALEFDPEAAGAVSPILFVSPDDPPTLLVHGTADTLVPIANSESLGAALEKAGVIHDFVLIEEGDHGFTSPEHRARAVSAMVAWFKQHLTEDQ